MKTVLVTGGASGLGRAITEHLASTGYAVVATYRGSKAAADDLERTYPDAVRTVRADLRLETDRARVVEVASEEGQLWGLVNNLGIYPEAWIEDIDTALFEAVFTLTCTVAFDLTQRCRPHFARGGRIINLGDSGADRIEARAQATPYHIAKLGVHVLTRTFAQRFGARGITVNMISPGFLENSVGEPGEPIPLGEPTRFEDILAALDFLLSDGARHVSGTNLLVNGGWNLG